MLFETNSSPEDQGFVCNYQEQNLGRYNKAAVLIPGLLPLHVSELKKNSAPEVLVLCLKILVKAGRALLTDSSFGV